MQIAGNTCFVCGLTIGVMRDGAGCVKCQRVFHRTCLTETVCPNCGASLLPTEAVHETSVGPSRLAGIGGWLLLPAIAFGLGPIGKVGNLFQAAALFSKVQAAGYGTLYALDIFMEAGLVGFVIFAATRFFRRKADAPKLIIDVLIVSVAAYAFFLVVALVAGAPVFATAAGQELARAAVGAAIWIPYFRMSRRVKATFVE